MEGLHRGDAFVMGLNEMACKQWLRHSGCGLVTGQPWVLHMDIVSNDEAGRITFRLSMSIFFGAASHHPLAQSTKEGEVLSQWTLHILFHPVLVQGSLVLSRWAGPGHWGRSSYWERERLPRAATKYSPGACPSLQRKAVMRAECVWGQSYWQFWELQMSC